MQPRLRKIIGATAACLAAGPLAAQNDVLPTLFDLRAETAPDIRAAPSAEAETIGTLAPYATEVEVVSLDASGSWGRLNTVERSGWIEMRFLERRPDIWREGALPERLRCLGTEPFWSLDLGGAPLIYSTPKAESAYRREVVLSPGFPSSRRLVTGLGDDGRITVTIVPALCSDGMSDRVYGLDATVLLDAGAPTMRLGCCTLAE